MRMSRKTAAGYKFRVSGFVFPRPATHNPKPGIEAFISSSREEA
jgi:hypothetical protein